jgi:hypothetical protein
MRAEHEEKLAAIHADWAEYRHEMAGLIQASESRLVERMHKLEVTVGDRIHGVETSLGERIHGVETSLGERLGERIHGVETSLGERLGERIGKVELRIAEVDAHVAEVKADLMKWSFVFWVGAVGAIAVLAGVLRD